MKNHSLWLLLGIFLLLSSCEKAEELLDECANCNDQIDNYINEYILASCTNITTNLNNDCGNTTSIEAAGLARETCLEGSLQHPGECNDIGRINTPFTIIVDGHMQDSLKFDLEHNGHSEINSVDHVDDLNLIFDGKINSGVVMEVRLYKIPGDSLMASATPTMVYARSEANVGQKREIKIKLDPITGYYFEFLKWN